MRSWSFGLCTQETKRNGGCNTQQKKNKMLHALGTLGALTQKHKA
jgi:hypothetical protein